jgi:hypothetical protein
MDGELGGLDGDDKRVLQRWRLAAGDGVASVTNVGVDALQIGTRGGRQEVRKGVVVVKQHMP